MMDSTKDFADAAVHVCQSLARCQPHCVQYTVAARSFIVQTVASMVADE
jgi:hypothetical protein